MRSKLLKYFLGVLHLLFWAACAFVLVCFLGALRWLRPGANPQASELLPLGFTLVLALGLFTIFYVYDTFWGERVDGPSRDGRP
jgi:cell division protein FtsW (lipid II flippase)